MGQQFLSAPPASGGPTPPPPSAGSRSAWPPPPPPNGQQPGGPGFGQSGSGDPQLSDTMERMLRPQGLFQRPQPKQYDWNSEWTPGAATASTGPTPITGAAPLAGPAARQGQQPTPPPGGPTTAPNPGLAPGGGAPQWGQSPTPPPGGQYPSGAYQTGAVSPAGGPTPPPPGYPAGGPPTTIDRFPGPGQYGPGGQFTGGQAGPGTYAQPALPQNGQGQLPPGQYGAGQYGQTTYAQGQYGAGQFGSGQLAPGQYGVDQYGATQVVQPYPDGQYGPGGGPHGPGGPGGPDGQYGMPGPYGPGGQFGPDGSPADGQKRPLTFGRITLPRSPLILGIAGAALVAIVAIVAVVSLSGNPGTPSGTSTAAGGGATPTSTSSSTGQSLTERQAAAQLAGLLKQSGSDHAAVNDAVVNVEKCGKNLGADAQTLSTSAANRQTLLAKLADLPGRSSLPSAMISDLSGAWQASASVDTDLAKWATHAATAGCHGGDLNYSSYKASINDDTPATNDKQAFVSAWNPLAKQDGLPTYQAAQL